MPSRAGVTIACWTTAAVSSTRRAVGHELIDLLRLRGRERRGPGRFVGDRVALAIERADLLLNGRDDLLRLARRPQQPRR